MSYTQFHDDCATRFVHDHPAADGWKVYTCFATLREKMYLRYLLDFVRDRPGLVTRRAAIGEVRTADMLGTPADSHAVTPGGEWDRDRELDANNWQGILEIAWNGEPIHYRSLMHSEAAMGHDSVTWVATKSNAALREFHAHLAAWGPARDRMGPRRVHAVNGADIPIPTTKWEDLILPSGMAEEIRFNVEGFFKSGDRYREMGIPHRRGFLFAGAPGCGKTLAIKAIIANTDVYAVALEVRGYSIDDMIESAFNAVRLHQPSLLVIEDLDRMVESDRMSVSYLLNLLDGMQSLEGVLVLASCNHPELLDAALLHRPSRFDRVWRFGVPTMKERLALLLKRGAAYYSPDVLHEAAARSEGFTMAYVQEIVVNALLESAHAGDQPTDGGLRSSLDTLLSQRRRASKPDEDLTVHEAFGFGSNGRATGD